MAVSLYHFSIRKQILIGYIPVLIVLVFLAFSSFQNFKKFDKNFNAFQAATQESSIFLKIERDVVELQRNVLVYSYVGYRGVLKKIDFIQKKLEEKFNLIQPIIAQDAEIKERFDRMIGHYDNYKKGFDKAVKEKQKLKSLSAEGMEPTVEKAQTQLAQIKNTFLDQNNFKAAYEISQMEGDLFETSANINAFRASPDSSLIKETRILISGIKDKSTALKASSSASTTLKQFEAFFATLKEYESIIKEIIRVNRNYLNLVNVVLAGKAAEINALSNELDDLIAQRSQALRVDIKNNINRSQKEFIILSLSAGLIGVLSSILIAMGIANPVSTMATTLSKLATGEEDTEIPGQERKDEIGQMAKAANEFKVMAIDLKSQTSELEEFAYRISHDLRSPLISSIGLLGIIQKAIANNNHDKAQKGIDAIKTSLIGLENMVQDILELSKIKNFEEEEEEIAVSHIIDSAIERLKHMDNYDRLSIETHVNLTKPLVSKKSRVVLIIENLISNAVKYQDTQKENSFVKITVEDHDDCVTISVEDNGLGIPEKHQKHIFSMFKRFHPRSSFGSGLGLYMLKKSADIIGGEVKFKNTGQGSKFTFTIPHKNETRQTL